MPAASRTYANEKAAAYPKRARAALQLPSATRAPSGFDRLAQRAIANRTAAPETSRTAVKLAASACRGARANRHRRELDAKPTSAAAVRAATRHPLGPPGKTTGVVYRSARVAR